MTAWVREWLLGVTCAAMALALVESLAPAGSVKKVCRLAGGLALLLAAVGPFLRADGVLPDVPDWKGLLDGYEETLAEQNEDLYKSIIEERTAAYIVDKAAEMGISCQAEVTYAYDESGTFCPWKVTAWGDWTGDQRERLGRMLETDLGVPPERQYYGEREP